MVSSVSSNQNYYSGVKIGAGLSAIGAVSAFGTPKLVDKMTGLVVKTSRKTIADNNKIIKDTLKSMAEHSGSQEISAMGKELVEHATLLRDNAYKTAKSMFDSRKVFKNINMKKALAIAVPFYLGAGAIVDYANNRQRAKSKPNAETKNGNEYVKVNMGKRLGGFLGLACEGGIIALNKVFKNSPKPLPNPLATIALGALGGYMLGALADKMSNKKAAKSADKNA